MLWLLEVVQSMPQLVGQQCANCGERISNELESAFCEQCGNPVHNRCRAPGDTANPYTCPVWH